jgi:hypothetical protein
MKRIIIATFGLVLLCSCLAPQVGKPKQAALRLPQDHLIRSAREKLEWKGWGPRFNVGEPLYVQTPSNVTEDFVGFTVGTVKPDQDGYVQLYCIVPVDPIQGDIGEPQACFDENAATYVHLNKRGNVDGYKTGKPQQAGRAYVAPAAGAPSAHP